MINANLLRGKIVANGYTQATFAEKIGMSKNTLSAKIIGKSDFTIGQVETMCQLLGVDTAKEIMAIFFDKQSQ